jgi:flavin-dependent dehydrogenase
MADFDLAIIGGGINGAGIARDAAGRGLKVVLLEQRPQTAPLLTCKAAIACYARSAAR